MTVKLNRRVKNFSIPSTSGKNFELEELAGRSLLLYFYPKDNTPGCTQEGIDFRDAYAILKKQKIEVLGVSRDSLKTHENFRQKYEFPFHLLSDEEEKLCEQFDVLKEKKNFGRTYMGIERSTFFIDSEGFLRAEWRKVKVKEHIAEVFETLKELL